jgi:broad specificity phosphatase PhoE
MDPKVCLLVSHNSRIQCLLDNIKPSTEKIRFQNCAIMELVLRRQYIKLSLVYPGEITEAEKLTDRPFYVVDNILDPSRSPKYVPYKTFEMRGTSCFQVIKRLKLLPEDIDLEGGFTFYIIRHGISEHNEKTKFLGIKIPNLKLDTSLIPGGISSAERAGDYINNSLIISGHLNIDRIYVSDLERTDQTVRIIMQKIGNVGVVPIVLPCASEVVKSGEGGNCDSFNADLPLYKKLARENYPACTTTKIRDQTSHCSKLDWRLYLEFYDSQMRGEYDSIYGRMTGSKPAKQQCRNTTVIAMAVYEMMHFKQATGRPLPLFIQERNNYVGGTRKKKRTKKNKNRY